MEGNDCYKFATVNRYLAATQGKPVRLVVDVGANVGNVSEEMKQYFPEARIFAFEAVPEHYRTSARRFARDARVTVVNAAVCGCHQFADDLGRQRLPSLAPLEIHYAPRCAGGSAVTRLGSGHDENYETLLEPFPSLTLDAVVAMVLAETGNAEVDYMKMDCEGCEHHALGCAREETIQKIRFVGGEYHGVERFYQVMKHKLFRTHYVNLVGDRGQGSFFAERIGEERTILRKDRDGMLLDRPWYSAEPIDWHVFREEFVAPEEMWSHGLA